MGTEALVTISNLLLGDKAAEAEPASDDRLPEPKRRNTVSFGTKSGGSLCVQR